MEAVEDVKVEALTAASQFVKPLRMHYQQVRRARDTSVQGAEGMRCLLTHTDLHDFCDRFLPDYALLYFNFMAKLFLPLSAT